MTTRIDHARIAHDVTQYYRYAMFSHKWEDDEPLFENVVRIGVYDLGESPHDKVQMFCRIVRDAGLHWAWSDTCCINKADHVVLQEALVAMFKWYQGSAVTIVFLRGVRSRTCAMWSVRRRDWRSTGHHCALMRLGGPVNFVDRLCDSTVTSSLLCPPGCAAPLSSLQSQVL
ncbi:hypothetical protein J3R82DRAFT_10031 [Butyriboletus roseoflavus]|nr:hypothetical protein J3R82DRAFT_10031 [Butyriboletus roseoflavus]